MIKISHLQKRFNKGKQNEIHVINNTSIEFPEKGLVALTGPSGCGKTTLLNVIGGLDKFESGTIDFDGIIINSYHPEQWDRIRNASIGYIFQNYNLIEDKTVYDNIEIGLNMAGLYQHSAVEERINYVLKSVGMYNYRRRNTLALSGGQQQRVAIARAIAKNPKVVLADEPTGNLDANNTFEIMSIIKKISQTCLVILVSHERELVEFYADRVIEIRDGQIISDHENSGNRTLEHIDDRNIYLKDLTLKNITDPIELNYYYAEQPLASANIKLIYLNNTLYVKADTGTKVKYLTDETEIRLIDDHYKKPETDDVSKYLFDLNQFGAIKHDTRRKSFIRFRDTLKDGFKKFLGNRKVLGKFFLIVCFVVACVIVFNLARISALTQESSYLTVGRNFIQVEITDEMTYADIATIIESTATDSIVPDTRDIYYRFSYENLYQGSGNKAAAISFIGGYAKSPVPVSTNQVDSSNVIIGSLPTTNREVMIDVWIADQLIANEMFINMGVSSYEDLIGVSLIGSFLSLPELTISGIVKTNSPVVILTDDNRFYFTSTKDCTALGTASDNYTLQSGNQITNDNEALVSADSGISVGSYLTVLGIRFTVVGIFADDAAFDSVVSNAAFEQLMVNEVISSHTISDWMSTSADYIYLYAENTDQAVREINSLGFTALNSVEQLKTENLAVVFETLIFVYIGLGVTLVYIVFMMRSSMLSRIKEIGIYRSIGATKKDIYKIFFSEIIAFTSIGSLPGYLFMTYIVYFIQSKLNELTNMLTGMDAFFYFPLHLFLIGLAGIYFMNIIFGLIPVFTLLRKTPSEINTKYDI
ncbi:MAG: ABC transporter ATP-binding protein/permease [Candidatus Izemoplasmatales bacterium]|jgi:ABC-type lipoprotein export system ATPase subunit/ABC-type antimicrobial peptide transport system permease subunit